MNVVSVVITLDDGTQIHCSPNEVKSPTASKRKSRTAKTDAGGSTSKSADVDVKTADPDTSPGTDTNTQERDEHEEEHQAEPSRPAVPMNHEPKVQLNWSRGKTRKHRPTHVAVFGTGFWYIGDVEGEARLFFKHVTGSEKQHECDPQLSVGRAKVCATKISQRLVDDAVSNQIDKNNAERMAEAFVEYVGEKITVGDATYRYRPKRTRREVNAAVVTYVAAGDRRLEVRMWNRAGTPFDEAMEVWVTEYVEKHSMIGWFKKRLPFTELPKLRVLALNVPPFHRLEWTKKGKNLWSTTYDDFELEVVEGPNTSQLQLRNNGKYKRLGEVVPLQCGPAKELRDHALTFLRDFEYARSRKRAEKKAERAAKAEDTKKTEPAESKADKPAENPQPKSEPKTASKSKTAAEKSPEKQEETKETKPKKARTRRKKTTKKVTKKSTKKQTEPAATPQIVDDDDDGGTVDAGSVDIEKLLEKAGEIASQIELPVVAD